MKQATFSLIVAALFGAFSAQALTAFDEALGPAKMDILQCHSDPNQNGGVTSLTVIPKDGGSFQMTGTVTGGMAKFIRLIPATAVTAAYTGKMVVYASGQDGMELHVVTTALGGFIHQTAVFQETHNFPALPMNCHMASIP